MIEKILLLLGLFVAGLAKAQIVNIPDAHFKAYLTGNSAINTNGDSEIQVQEAAAFTGTIHCDSLDILDLTGIEAFVNSTKLWCYNNQLTHLDVSQNTALTDLQCDGNRLASLDLSHNTALKTLWCYSNQLTVLNISAHMALEDLRCYDNQLTDLDVSDNAALEKLYCDLNRLTRLDVSKNLVLKELFCSWNQLTGLNLKNGNNGTLATMLAKNNPSLGCIQVDDVANAHSYQNWTKDAAANFNTDCNYLSAIAADKKPMILYPNPVNEILHFSQEVTAVTIMDISGKTLKYLSASVQSASVADLAKGIYLIKFKIKPDKVMVQKFIKL